MLIILFLMVASSNALVKTSYTLPRDQAGLE